MDLQTGRHLHNSSSPTGKRVLAFQQLMHQINDDLLQPEEHHGLYNQGATCYLNSVLQVLRMTGDFRAAVGRYVCENPDTEYIDRHLNTLFDNLQKKKARTFGITKQLGIASVNEQRDAAEYFEKILSLTSPKASEIFHGLLTHTTKCSRCGAEADADGAFWHLPLTLVDSCSEHYNVLDGIKEYFRAADFSGENQMYCDECDGKSDATIRCVMKRHPEVLTLLLKRFEFDYSYMEYVKDNRAVAVPFTLQIPENQTYQLYAVVDHFGNLRGGHYTATIRDDETWRNFNDERVTSLDYQPFQVDDSEKSQYAYLLFYRKVKAAHAADDCAQKKWDVSTPRGLPSASSEIHDQDQDDGWMGEGGEVSSGVQLPPGHMESYNLQECNEEGEDPQNREMLGGLTPDGERREEDVNADGEGETGDGEQPEKGTEYSEDDYELKHVPLDEQEDEKVEEIESKVDSGVDKKETGGGQPLKITDLHYFPQIGRDVDVKLGNRESDVQGVTERKTLERKFVQDLDRQSREQEDKRDERVENSVDSSLKRPLRLAQNQERVEPKMRPEFNGRRGSRNLRVYEVRIIDEETRGSETKRETLGIKIQGKSPEDTLSGGLRHLKPYCVALTEDKNVLRQRSHWKSTRGERDDSLKIQRNKMCHGSRTHKSKKE